MIIILSHSITTHRVLLFDNKRPVKMPSSCSRKRSAEKWGQSPINLLSACIEYFICDKLPIEEEKIK
jgi:hypothetical protein